MAARERLEERALVLHGAARGVDEDRPRLHERERLRVDHLLRLGRERRVAREDVDLWQELLETLDGLRAPATHFVARNVLVVAEDAHPDRAGELRHAPADVPDAHDAERLAGELAVAHDALGSPVTPAGRLVDQQGALHAGEHEHQRVLGHGLGVRAGGVDDRDSEPGRGGDVHRVQTDSVSADDLELRATRHQALGAARPEAEQDPRRLGGDPHEPGLGLIVADDDARLPLEERLAVGIDRASEHDQGARLGGHRTGLLSLEVWTICGRREPGAGRPARRACPRARRRAPPGPSAPAAASPRARGRSRGGSRSPRSAPPRPPSTSPPRA